MLAVGVTEKDVMEKYKNSNFKNPLLNKLDQSLGGLLDAASVEEDFTGKSGQSLVLRVSCFNSKRVGLFGLGKSASTAASTAATLVGLGEAIAAAAKASQAASVAVALAFAEDLSDDSKPDIASAIAIGTCSKL